MNDDLLSQPWFETNDESPVTRRSSGAARKRRHRVRSGTLGPKRDRLVEHEAASKDVARSNEHSKGDRIRSALMTPDRLGTSVEFPNQLEIRLTRDLEAPKELVFDVLTRPEHVREWFAPFEHSMTVCSIDLRVGGKYHFVFETGDGTACSFRGSYLEIEPPTRTVATWMFEGWPDAEAVETVDLLELNGVTKIINRLAFRDKIGRDHMSHTDGFEDTFDKLALYIGSLSDSTVPAAKS